MYLQNKYTNTYNNIVNHAQLRILPDDVYTERHHIIPRSLGGSNDNTNLVTLTAREHYICHLLLTKMTTGLALRSMWHALWKIINQKTKHQQRHKVTSRVYEKVRQANAKALSEANTGKKQPKTQGREVTWADKISKSLLAKNLKGVKKPTSQCVFCGMIAANHIISRFHNDNCKIWLPVVPKVRKKMKPRTPEHSEAIRQAKLRNKALRQNVINTRTEK